MVGLQVLILTIGVRIPISEPRKMASPSRGKPLCFVGLPFFGISYICERSDFTGPDYLVCMNMS
jgi:hypothetical protein